MSDGSQFMRQVPHPPCIEVTLVVNCVASAPLVHRDLDSEEEQQGLTSRCCIGGFGVAEDHIKAYVLARESAAAGSCMEQHVLGVAFSDGEVVAQDKAEAVRSHVQKTFANKRTMCKIMSARS